MIASVAEKAKMQNTVLSKDRNIKCEDVDDMGVEYGSNKYDYAGSCEIWRIIGVFDVDNGYGINQWGLSTYTDGTIYLGADLMQLLNGKYLNKQEAQSACYDMIQKNMEPVILVVLE